MNLYVCLIMCSVAVTLIIMTLGILYYKMKYKKISYQIFTINPVEQDGNQLWKIHFYAARINSIQ